MLGHVGMHFGFIGADCDWAALHAALEGHCGALVDQREIAAEDWFDLPRGQDVFHVATRDGRVYLLDPSMVLSSSTDMIVALASELSCVADGKRGPGNFPAPRGVVGDAVRVWRWADVDAWLRHNAGYNFPTIPVPSWAIDTINASLHPQDISQSIREAGLTPVDPLSTAPRRSVWRSSRTSRVAVSRSTRSSLSATWGFR